MPQYIQVLTTTGRNDDAERIATMLVDERLAACVQVLGPIGSTYRWKNEIENAQEWLCLIKTRMDLYAEVEKAIRAAHPYEEPEIVAVPIVTGSASYLAWIEKEVRPAKRA
ncbi:MAG: divalent-cation tolerance protein CutA [Thermoguttaceae bacterium]